MFNLENKLWKLEKYEDELLSTAILYNQLPLKMLDEQKNFILDKIKELGIKNWEEDSKRNLFLPFIFDKNKSTILVFTTIDEIENPLTERFVRVEKDKIEGLGIASCSFKIASLLTIIKFLYLEEIRLDNNVIFLFLNQSGKNKFSGLGEFLQEQIQNFDFAIKVNGINLGDLGNRSLGKYLYNLRLLTRNSIHKSIKSPSTLEILYNLTSSLKENSNMEGTSVNILKLESFESYTQVILEIKSQGDQDLEIISENLRSAVAELANKYKIKIKLNLLSYIPTSFLPVNHPLIEQIKDIHNSLKLQTRFIPLEKDEALIIKSGIPAISLAVAKGEISDDTEYIEKNEIIKGLIQILKVLDSLFIEDFYNKEINDQIVNINDEER
ncbi:hypothetical protein [Petrotoga sp. 9PWA.NaAc.5.4]|uniref:hypothetical protein n=1 Tax=Petrotoga sp. 9PWA.NaAc.5.4 TaxID=1434328 RepID=UPI000CB7E45A|nr:hypothetical protein [Petrotoga sp. 9PWA.NaAc.5.4]PNR95838.1 hypothetical protein X924_03620 [Petrotoga sp. 9PWA.NaAc.5.4]